MSNDAAAPAAPSSSRPALVASPDVAVRTAKAVHDACHEDWKHHVRYCLGCFKGRRCRIAAMLADRAEDAGKRWRLAEERSRR